MREDGVLTTIDVEPEHQRSAKQAFSEASIAPSRTRLIGGRAQEVLPRLADESYDLLVIDAVPADQPDFLAGGIRLLRPGGAVVIHGHRPVDGPATPAPTIQTWSVSARPLVSSPTTAGLPPS